VQWTSGGTEQHVNLSSFEVPDTKTGIIPGDVTVKLPKRSLAFFVSGEKKFLMLTDVACECSPELFTLFLPILSLNLTEKLDKCSPNVYKTIKMCILLKYYLSNLSTNR
jgi:hypothetical protein